MVQNQAPGIFTILHEDEHLVAVAKPSGWAVHPGWAPKERSILGFLSQQVGRYLYPAHRLDRGTSGVLLFALTKEAARHLNTQFAERQIEKRYLAWVRGHPKTDSGFVDHPIPRREGSERAPAQTAWLCLHRLATSPRESSLLAFAPKTGRLHQIRRHARHLNHPLLGDSRYGRPRLNRAFRKQYGLKRLSLHAWALKFRHPDNGKPMAIRCAVPETLQRPLLSAGHPWDAQDDPLALLFPQHEEASTSTSLDQNHDLG